MAWRGAGSFSRSLMSAARSPLLRSPPPVPRVRPSRSAVPRLQSRRLSFGPSRNLGELGCVQSFLPLQSVVPTARLTSHLTVNGGMEKMGDARGLSISKREENDATLYLKGHWINRVERTTYYNGGSVGWPCRS